MLCVTYVVIQYDGTSAAESKKSSGCVVIRYTCSAYWQETGKCWTFSQSYCMLCTLQIYQHDPQCLLINVKTIRWQSCENNGSNSKVTIRQQYYELSRTLPWRSTLHL